MRSGQSCEDQTILRRGGLIVAPPAPPRPPPEPALPCGVASFSKDLRGQQCYGMDQIHEIKTKDECAQVSARRALVVAPSFCVGCLCDTLAASVAFVSCRRPLFLSMAAIPTLHTPRQCARFPSDCAST